MAADLYVVWQVLKANRAAKVHNSVIKFTICHTSCKLFLFAFNFNPALMKKNIETKVDVYKDSVWNFLMITRYIKTFKPTNIREEN